MNRWIIFIVCLYVSPSIAIDPSEEIMGFTVDHTITRVGHDFARYLSDIRHREFFDSKYNLTVYERPSARWGNLVWVEHNRQRVFSYFFQPNSKNVKEKAEQAASIIDDSVRQRKLRAMFIDTFDLEKSEL